MTRTEAFDRATVGNVPTALEMAGRPGAAALFLAVDGMIRSGVVSDEEMGRLGQELATATLQKIDRGEG